MVIDLHSHFFPIEALQNPGRYQHRAAKIAVDQGKLSVTSQIGMRAGSAPELTIPWRVLKRWMR
jgi:hypothetical protein